MTDSRCILHLHENVLIEVLSLFFQLSCDCQLCTVNYSDQNCACKSEPHVHMRNMCTAEDVNPFELASGSDGEEDGAPADGYASPLEGELLPVCQESAA